MKNDIVLEESNILKEFFERFIRTFYKKENNNKSTCNKNEVEIIDISNITTSQVISNAVIDNSKSSELSLNWIDKLSLPYERKVMEVTQIKRETLNFFNYLCDFLDNMLKNNNTSLNKLIRKIENGNNHYNNILYTIYCISEGHVTFFYSGTKKYYDPEFSYQVLKDHLGEDLKNHIYNKAIELEKYMSSPDNKTREYFKLPERSNSQQNDNSVTDNLYSSNNSLHLNKPLLSSNLKFLWWDGTGEFREERKFTKRELNLLSIYSLRNTKIWNYYNIRKQIVLLYLDIWSIIIKKLNDDKIIWNIKNIDFLQNIIKNGTKFDYEVWNDKRYHFMSSLCKIAEYTIRLKIPSQSKIDISYEQKIVKKYLPSSVCDTISEKLLSYTIPNIDFLKMLDVLLDGNPNNQNLQLKRFLLSNLDEKLNILSIYRTNKNYTDFIKKILKSEENTDIFLICLFELNRIENLNPNNQRLLNSIIHESNRELYLNMLEFDGESLVDIFNELILLKEVKRKKIDLDISKIETSKKELKNTIDIIEEYINAEEEIEDEHIIETNLINDNENLKENELIHKEFIVSLLDKELPVNKVEEIASNKGLFLNTFINEVNKDLYRFVEDESIIVEDDYVMIDEFYFNLNCQIKCTTKIIKKL